MLRKTSISAVFAAAAIFSGLGTAVAHEQIKIGTGGNTGVYYATGQAICDLVADGVACEAPSTKGSVANLNSLAAGEINFAMAQSDWQFHAHRGSSQWEGEQFEDLRAVMSVYAEPLQIVVNREAGINRWRDLRGKSINIGNPGSGQRQTFDLVLSTERMKYDVFSSVHELSSSEHVSAFCEGKFDAFVFTVGIPNAAMQRAVAECNGKLLEPNGTTVRKLATAARPYYARKTIPAGTYWDKQERVRTFGVLATLVTHKDVSDEAVASVLNAVFGDFDAFKDRHPAFAESTPESMVADGLSAPLHPAAEAFYTSKGWLK